MDTRVLVIPLSGIALRRQDKLSEHVPSPFGSGEKIPPPVSSPVGERVEGAAQAILYLKLEPMPASPDQEITLSGLAGDGLKGQATAW
jgi:hypothetical protein